jgi:AraC-like DNA-binding protein
MPEPCTNQARNERPTQYPGSTKTPPPMVGEPFNPFHEVSGFYPPDIVARRLDLTDGEKRLYERAVRWAGKNSRFWYSFSTMAKELGKSVRQVKRDMATLEGISLLVHQRRGRRQSNIYLFLYHQMFTDEVTSATPHPRSEKTNSPDDGIRAPSCDGPPVAPHPQGEGTFTSPREVSPAAHELCKENSISESSSRFFSKKRKQPVNTTTTPIYSTERKAKISPYSISSHPAPPMRMMTPFWERVPYPAPFSRKPRSVFKRPDARVYLVRI